MTAHANQLAPIKTVALFGRLDAVSAVEFRKELSEAFSAEQFRIIVDLTMVDFVDSAGLAALASGMRTARQNGGDLRVAYPESLSARRVFSLTRFDQVFQTVDPRTVNEQTW